MSVVIPARNAAATLGQTLDCLAAQTMRDWEAFVVDDASDDDTGAIAATRAAEDPRIRVLRSAGGSEGAARNVGISNARGPWFLFLDADDLIEPETLERALSVLDADDGLDGVVYGWTRFRGESESVNVHHWTDRVDPFGLVSTHTPFPMHACVIRASLVVAVGGFDPSLRGVADWDLWQRVFRSGARLERIGDVLGRYRLHASAMSNDAAKMFEASLRVMKRSYGIDARVADPVPAYARGGTATDHVLAVLRHLSWWSGVAIGAGQDPTPMFAVAREYLDAGPGLLKTDRLRFDAELLGASLEESIRIPGAAAIDEWPRVWDGVGAKVRDLLKHFEELTGNAGLAWKAELLLQPPRHGAERAPDRMGDTQAVDVELTAPIEPIEVAGGIRRLLCVGRLAGRTLGLVELPVFDGRVDDAALRDALASRFSWDLTRRSLERHGAISASSDGHETWRAVLRELWPPPQPGTTGEPEHGERRGPVEIRVGAAASLLVAGAPAEVLVTVAGAPVDIVSVAAAASRSPTRLRAALTRLAGPELVRVLAREVLLGSPADLPIREEVNRRYSRPDTTNRTDALLAIGRRRVGGPATVAMRRASLPRRCAEEIEGSARTAGEEIVVRSGAGGVVYDPSLAQRLPLPISTGELPPGPHDRWFGYDRFVFEAVFASRDDPWSADSANAAQTREEILSALPGALGRVLDVGCDEGHLTADLAGRAEHVTAVDISEIALERARARCSSRTNITFQRSDVFHDELPRDLDAIVCSEVLCYAPSKQTLRATARKLARSLRKGGRLVTAHAAFRTDPATPGFQRALPFGAGAIEEALARVARLRLIGTSSYAGVRVNTYERVGVIRNVRSPVAVDAVAGNELPWSPLPHAPVPLLSQRLPILRYRGAEARQKAVVEEQLTFLRESRFRTIPWDRWEEAARVDLPIHGRAVALSFESDAEPFLRELWPLLRGYGFSATLLVGTESEPDEPTWDSLRGAHADGLDIGWRFTDAIGVDLEEVACRASRARAWLQQRLGRPVGIMSHDLPCQDGAFMHTVGACGFVIGLTDRADFAQRRDPLLDLPRLTVDAGRGFADFVRKVTT